MTKENRTLEIVAQEMVQSIINGDAEGVAKLLSELDELKSKQD